MSSNIQTMSIVEKQQAIIKWIGSGAINVFGRPFAGKDVQCGKINEWLNASIIGGGDIIRTQQEAEHLRESHDRGELAPQQEFIQLITRYFSQDNLTGKPLILSSLGRWHGEEAPICNAAQESGHPVKAVVYIEITEDTVRERFEKSGNRGRHDDNEQVLKTRLNEFREKTLPVIDYYKDKGILVKINGNQAPESVQQEIVDSLYELSAKN